MEHLHYVILEIVFELHWKVRRSVQCPECFRTESPPPVGHRWLSGGPPCVGWSWSRGSPGRSLVGSEATGRSDGC